MTQAKVMQVIQTKSNIGKGVDGDPVRELVEYFTLDGKLLVNQDDWQERETLKMLQGIGPAQATREILDQELTRRRDEIVSNKAALLALDRKYLRLSKAHDKLKKKKK